MSNTIHNTSFRAEIQGLRALAVLMVLLYHIWPWLLPGGYIGVDVFFVISGYLITGLLLKEAENTGRISVKTFYSRRIRRLLPAATLVIVTVAAVTPLVPSVRWSDTATEILASAFYFQNWWLGYQAIDYLAMDNAPGLLRHYWSLSVEEQYYILWPLLFLSISLIFPSFKRRPRLAFTGIIFLISFISLIYSVYLTNHNPGLAYFSTATRAWELALGGAVAVLAPSLKAIREPWSRLLGWIGVAVICIACVFFDQATRFPGYAALLPTLGAALVIIAGRSDVAWSAYGVLATRPMQYLGNISYSLYLWHWPLIVFYTLGSENSLSVWSGLTILLASVVLAHLTKVYVEDPYRNEKNNRLPLVGSSLTIFLTSCTLVLLAANIVWAMQAYGDSNEMTKSMSANMSDLLQQPYDASKPTFPALQVARKDNPDMYAKKCHVDQVSAKPLKCVFGREDAKYNVVLVGDSHAAQWLPSIQVLFNDKPDWRIVTYTKSACAFNATSVSKGRDKQEYTSCTEWNDNVLAEIKLLKPDIIFTSQSSRHRAFGVSDAKKSQQILAEGLLQRWDELKKLGSRIIVIRDTPWMNVDVPECLSSSNGSIQKCSTKVSDAFKSDPIVLAIKSGAEVEYMDLSHEICDVDFCKPVHGQILVWRDRHHLTATYARLLASEFFFLQQDMPGTQ